MCNDRLLMKLNSVRKSLASLEDGSEFDVRLLFTL